TIDLDRYEVAVQQLGDRGILERLVLHHVAPVARRVADRKKDRFVLAARAFERVVAPGMPVDRIARVLQEIWAALGGEAVHIDLYYRAMHMELAVQTSGLTRDFGSFRAVDGINLSVPAGSFYGF